MWFPSSRGWPHQNYKDLFSHLEISDCKISDCTKFMLLLLIMHVFSLPALLEMSSKSVTTISELKIACDEAHNKKYKKGRFLGKVRLTLSHSQTMLQVINVV